MYLTNIHFSLLYILIHQTVKTMSKTHRLIKQYEHLFNSEKMLEENTIRYFFEGLSDNELDDLLKALKNRQDKPKSKSREKLFW